MRNIVCISCFAILGTIACNNSTPNSPGKDNIKVTAITAPKEVRSNLNDTGTTKLVAVITDYYSLKNALVATNETNTASAANVLSTAAKSLQGYLIEKEGMPGPLKPYLDTIIIQTRTITETTDKSCEKQRLAFGTLSSALYGLIKNTEVRNISIYHTYCPMAFNEKGATWLSNESEIKNPYFGDKMLECGEVTDSIK